MGLMYGAGGYVAAAIASHFAILLFSSNAHDRSVEAAMTNQGTPGRRSGHEGTEADGLCFNRYGEPETPGRRRLSAQLEHHEAPFTSTSSIEFE